MADLALSAAQTLFAALQCPQLQDFCDMLGYKSHLKDLEKTISTVKKVLIGAEIRDGELSPEEEEYIEKLKDAVYDADDLFDELLALSELKKYKTTATLTTKVRLFFSSVNPLSVAHNASNKIKVIRKNLEDIANDHNKFGLKFDSHPIRKRKPETNSSVNEFEVIGREGDTKAVIDRLLESNEEIGFLSIVGVGGLGKTTLAQLVYNDERIKKEFELRFWVCVSDHDKERFDVRVILSNIVELVTTQKPYDNSSMEMVQCKFKDALEGKKCMIVLDDIWNEDRYKWLELNGFFMRLGKQSRILVTTRSVETTTIIGNGITCTYRLGGLSPKNSWRLFSLMAFGNMQEHDIPTEYVDTGRKIVQKCCCVPLVLKVVGSLLFKQDKSKWDAFKHMEVTRIKKGDNEIMSILKFSYLHLESPLKSCFKYCAIFPKNYRLKKEMLIRLWEAQGYIVPFEEGQSIQDAGEEYFSILLKRCFFQEAEENVFGEVLSCKMHDFMHDLAEKVARDEIWRSNCTRGTVEEKVRHLGHNENGDNKLFPFSSKIRSCLMYGTFEGVSLLSDICKRLRVLKLEDDNIKTLPETIGNCLHLRSLDLSRCCNLRTLPNSIAKLQSLQSLDISYCKDLKELPKELSKLGKLKHLDFEGCKNITYMPLRMDKLICLTSLTKFVVNEGNDPSENQHGELNDIQFLTELSGYIDIRVKKYTNNGKKKEEGGYLKRLEHLKAVRINFKGSNVMRSDAEALMEKLEPHTNLIALLIYKYNGSIIPKWGRELDDWAIIMPGLVAIEFRKCEEMKELPLLSRLRHLKILSISELPNLGYMEDFNTADGSSKESVFFPSLCDLKLKGLDNLKGWWSNPKGIPCLHRLVEIKLKRCKEMKELPLLSRLRYLKKLTISDLPNLEYMEDFNTADASSKESEFFPALCYLELEGLDNLKGWWSNQKGMSCFPRLVEIKLKKCKNMKELPLLSRLRYLKKLAISKLPNLEYMEDLTTVNAGSKESEFFPSLSHLELEGLDNLKGWWSCEQEIPCLPRLPRLSKLHIHKCPNFVSSLCCPSLEELHLIKCNQGLSISRGNDNNINPTHDVELKKVWVDTLDYFESMHRKNLRLTNITVFCGWEIGITSKAEELFKSNSSSLRHLDFFICKELSSISGGLEHLSSLETLSLRDAPELRFDEEDQPWRSLSHTLRSLTLWSIPKPVSLPKGLQYLTNLQQLSIKNWDNLESIPEGIGSLSSLRELLIEGCPKIKSLPSEMSKLTSLQKLYIVGCTEELYQRCQQHPQGDDWLNIRHVPHIDISK